MIIWIASYPKSGNTWLRAIMSQVIFNNDIKDDNWISDIHKHIDSYPKFKHFKNLNSESVIRQSTELGVKNIYPTFFQRTVIKKLNLNKFTYYSIGAAQQCGRMSIPTIDNYQKLIHRVDLLSNCHVLMFDENLQGEPIQKVNSSTLDNKTEIIVIIGPEGGFEEQERQIITKNSRTFQNIKLGPRILKADTAVIAALSLTFHYFS